MRTVLNLSPLRKLCSKIEPVRTSRSLALMTAPARASLMCSTLTMDSSRPSISNMVPFRKSFVLIKAAEKLHSEYVPIEAQACDHSPRGARRHAAGAELFAGVNVGDMHLHHRHRERLETIVEGERVVRQRPGVDDDPSRARGLLLQEVDDLALVVALEQRNLAMTLACGFANQLVQVGQGAGAVDLRLALAQQVQVGPVDDDDLLHASA